MGKNKELSDLTIRLDMEPAEFGELQFEFRRSLARTLEISPSDVEILGYHAGCVDVDARLPNEPAKALDDAARDKKLRSRVQQNFLKEWKVLSVKGQGAAFSEATIHISPDGKTLTWLHLSDIHLKAPNEPDAPAQGMVCDKLVEQIGDRLEVFNLRPDFIFVTGDISQSAEPAQFSEGINLLGKLRAAVGAKDPPIISIPGNHDVHWGAIKDSAEDLDHERRAKQALVDHRAVENFLVGAEHQSWRESLFKRLDNFRAFTVAAKAYGQPEMRKDTYYFAFIKRHLGIDVGIAGLNSAWRSSHELDRGQLMLSRRQLDEIRHVLRSAKLKIALVHHPIASDWYARFDGAYQETALYAFDFILNGHEHVPHIRGVTPGPRAAYHNIAAGALYTNEKDYVNSFNCVRVDLDTARSTAFFWKFSDIKLRWHADTESFPDFGHEEFALPPQLATSLGIRHRTIGDGDGPSF